jgi:3-deoxy-D-manno-octulosonate 8-phosphate phosphatase (KDO 8-P phosphatase)
MSGSDPFARNRSWTPELDRKARRLGWLLLDVDGVLTDGRLHYGPSGEALKVFHVRDGFAVKLAQRAGLAVGIVSGRDSAIVAERSRELGIEEVVQGRNDKGAALRELLARRGLEPSQVAYIGDDLPDLPALALAGFSAAPADAVAEVRAAVDFVTEAAGGAGAVRELVERLLVARRAWDAVLASFREDEAGDGGR